MNNFEIQKKPSPAVIKRLPRYYRYLRELLANEKTRISSAELARIMNVTASQIRQDLNCFGGFGQQGYGYNVEHLYSEICNILGVNEGYRAVIVGAGNLGRALARSPMLKRRGVRLAAMFDTDRALIGRDYNGIPVLDVATLPDYCQKNGIDIGILTLPREQAPNAARMLEAGAVRGIWNFTSTELPSLPPCIALENVHLGDSLMTLCYKVKNGKKRRSVRKPCAKSGV